MAGETSSKACLARRIRCAQMGVRRIDGVSGLKHPGGLAQEWTAGSPAVRGRQVGQVHRDAARAVALDNKQRALSPSVRYLALGAGGNE